MPTATKADYYETLGVSRGAHAAFPETSRGRDG